MKKSRSIKTESDPVTRPLIVCVGIGIVLLVVGYYLSLPQTSHVDVQRQMSFLLIDLGGAVAGMSGIIGAFVIVFGDTNPKKQMIRGITTTTGFAAFLVWMLLW